MEGFIKIEAIPGKGMFVETDLRRVSGLDKLVLLDALATALELKEKDRKFASMMLMLGGLGAIPGIETQTVEVDKDAVEFLKKMRDDEST